MKEIKCILKQKVLIVKNAIKIAMSKYTAQLFISVILAIVIAFYSYSYLKSYFEGTYLAQNANFLIFIKAMYFSIGILIVISSFAIMAVALKDSINTWKSVRMYPILSDKIYISSMIFYLMIVTIIITFIILSIGYIMKINIWIILLFILFLFLLLIGNLIFTFSIYKVINILFKNQIVFYLTISGVLASLYYINSIFFKSKSFEQTNIFDYVFIFLPFILGIILLIFLRNYNIIFSINKERNIKNSASTKLFFNIKNLYISILFVEFYRNITNYLEFLIIPYFIYVICIFLNIRMNYNNIIPAFSIVSCVSLGFYYSYNNAHKLTSVNIKFVLLTRGIFSLMLISFNYLIFSLIEKHMFNINYYMNCMLLSLFVYIVFSMLKLPLKKYGRDYVMFYIVASLIPFLYEFIISMFINIIGSYFNIVVYNNLVTFILNLVLISYNIALLRNNENEIL